MSDNQIFESEEVKPIKKGRKAMTEERKQAVKLQLAKGREKALENRRKKALLKKLEKEEQHNEIEEKLKEKIKNKKTSSELEDEINELQQLLLKATAPKEPESVKEPVKEPESVKEQPAPKPIESPAPKIEQPAPKIEKPAPIPVPRKLVFGGTYKPALW